MSTLKQMLQSAQTGQQLYVTPAHVRWMERPESERVPTEAVFAIMKDVILGERQHPRSERYSPSSLGMCNRRVLYGYHGAQQDPTPVDSLDLMFIGTTMHRQWQWEGLTAGYMRDVEVWTTDEARLGGSMDAVLDDGSIFELKTMRSQVYSRLASEPAPKFEHLLQIEAYMRCSGRTQASVLYQDRDSGQTREYRVLSSPYHSDKLDELLERLDYHVDIDVLPQMLNDCQTKTGWVYKSCPYATTCMSDYLEGR